MRRQRVDYDGAVHHVMNRGVNRQRVFFGDADRVQFGELLAEIHDRFEVETLAYCLMDNHYHLLLRTPSAGLAAAMQHLGGVYTRRTNNRIGRDGPLFRGRYHSIHVTTDAYLTMAARYIHRNPLERTDVSSAADYRWSSYRTYLGLRATPGFVTTEPVLGLYGNDHRALALHTEDGHESCSDQWTVADVDQLIAFEIARHDVRYGDDQAPRLLDRTFLVLLAEADINTPLRDALHQRLAFSSATARRLAVSRAARLAASEPRIAQISDHLIHRLARRRPAA